MTREALIKELLKLPPAELLELLDALVKELEAEGRLELAKQIIERYRPALEELASK